MSSTVRKHTLNREGKRIFVTMVDGDIYKIVEQYFDDEGYVIYERTCDYSTVELLKLKRDIERREQKKKDKNNRKNKSANKKYKNKKKRK